MRAAIAAIVLAIRFACELVLVAAVAVLAWDVAGGGILGALAAGAGMTVVATTWGTWIAPRAARRLADPARLGFELLLFVVGSAAAASAWNVTVGVVFAIAAVGTALAVSLTGEPVPPR